MESNYLEFKTNIETRILKVTNISLVIVNCAILIVGLIELQNVPFRAGALTASILALVVRRFSMNLSKLLVMGSYTTSLIFVITNSVEFIEKGIPRSYFLYGNSIGIVEFMVVLSIKNTYVKLIFILVNFGVKIALFPKNFNLQMSIIFAVILASSLLFYIYYDFLERKNFKIIYETREQSKRFQSLLSKDFPASVLIMSSDFQSIIYSNNFFQQKFGNKSQEDSSIPILFMKFTILKNNQVQNLFPVQQEINFFELIQKLQLSSETLKYEEGFTFAATFNDDHAGDQNEENMSHFEIKIRRIKWGTIPAFTLIFNDTSDKQMLMALKFADEQKDKVIATVSHELRTPINGILGLIEMIKMRIKDDEIAKTYLENCKSCSNLLLYLVNSILDLSLLRHNKLNIVKTFFNLNLLLEEMRTLYLFQSQSKKIEFFVINEVTDHSLIYTDRHRLIEILINLLGNAFKFTFKGSITLKVAPDAEDTNKIIFSIIDTGIGIKEEEKPKLFKMFGKIPQADKNINSHGAGLGLTIVSELVKTLNEDGDASFTFESEYNKGTTFHFKINHNENSPFLTSHDSLNSFQLNEFESPHDIVSAKVEQIQNTEDAFHFFKNKSPKSPSRIKSGSCDSLNNIIIATTENERNYSNSKNLLVVDDNPFNILAATFILQKFGYNVSKACSGEECIKMLEASVKQNKKFEIIFMDIQMPVLDGLETSKILNEKIRQGILYNVPIVALTANKLSKKLKDEYLENGIVSCLEKPLLEEKIKKLFKSLGLK